MRVLRDGLEIIGLDAGNGVSLLGALVGVEPGAFEEVIDFLDAEARQLRHHEVDVEQGDEAPGGEEDEGAPVVGAREEGRHAALHRVQEQPVEGRGEGAAEGPDPVGPEFGAEDVWEDE